MPLFAPVTMIVVPVRSGIRSTVHGGSAVGWAVMMRPFGERASSADGAVSQAERYARDLAATCVPVAVGAGFGASARQGHPQIGNRAQIGTLRTSATLRTSGTLRTHPWFASA
ncbi:hypothetical protein GCM10009749_25180 [Agromyces neolithicus]|uniref:Uncharacterized protein n=1 Tax=Agromyces neolithicus TaxID=269420 RepID=A0ABP4YH75_9MICO